MPRLFLAIELPEAIKSHLSFFLKDHIHGAKWVQENQQHLTLLFLDEVPQHKYESVLDLGNAVAEIAYPFSLQLKGVNFLGPAKSPKVLYLGCEPNEDLNNLHALLVKKAAQLKFEIEKRKFLPHVTLARLHHPSTEQLGRFLENYSLVDFAPFEVKSIVLFESRLDPQGATYLLRERFEL